MNLHGKIMNLQDGCGLSEIGTSHGEQLAYKRGHKSARHAAAELAAGHDAEYEDLRAEIARCFDIAQRLDMVNPMILGAFTGTPSERIQRQLDAML